MKNSSNNFITLRKMGGFYQCFDDDSYILYYLFNYKITNKRCGFPHSSLSKIINNLESKKISYKIIDDKIKDNTKDFKKLNNYNHYLKLGIDKYNLDTKKKSLEDKIRDMPFSKIEKLYKMIEDYVSE